MFSQTGGQEWVKQISANNVLSAVDPQGNLYVAGKFTGTVDFDPEPEVFELTAIGFSDMFVCKLNAEGDFL